MKPFFLLVLFSCMLLISCSNVDNAYVFVEHVKYDYGPVNIKVDSEWLIEKTSGKFIRIGFGQEHIDYTINNDEHPVKLSKKQYATANYILENELQNTKTVNIVAFDIPMIQNHELIDIDLFVDIRPSANKQKMSVALRPKHRLYIYNPVKKKWFSLTEFDFYFHLSVIELMDEEFYNKELNSIEDYLELFSKQSSKNADPYYVASIIEKREIQILPSDSYEKNFKDYLIESDPFNWWNETKISNEK